MSKIILVTGGARSGKSGFAESLCREQNNSTAYIATSVAFDIKKVDLKNGKPMKSIKTSIK